MPRPARPGNQAIRVDLGNRITGQKSQVLAQIEHLTQFGYRHLPRPNLITCGALQQPSGQRRASALCLSRIDKFENRALPKQIQIHRVRMMRVQEFRA